MLEPWSLNWGPRLKEVSLAEVPGTSLFGQRGLPGYNPYRQPIPTGVGAGQTNPWKGIGQYTLYD